MVKQKIHIYLITLLMVFALASPAYAFVPFILTAAEAAAPIVASAGVSWLLAPSGGNISKTGYADNYGVKRNVIGKVGATLGLAAAGYMIYEDIRGNIASNPSAYPNLKSAMYNTGTYPATSNIVGVKPVVQSNYYADSKYLRVTSIVDGGWSAQPAAWVASPGYLDTGSMIYTAVPEYHAGFPDAVHVWKNYYTVISVTPVTTPKSDSEVASTLGLNELYPQYQPEIDAMVQANPSQLAVPSADVSAVKNAVIDNASQTKQAATDARIANASDAVAARQAAYDANPTPENLALLNEAKATLADAEYSQASDAESDAFGGSFTPPEPPELVAFNFQPLMDLGDDLDDKFPFTLLQTVKAMAHSFIATPQTPVFTISFPAPFNYDWNISLERWDNLAAFIRYLTGATFLAVCTMAIFRRWA